MKNSERYFELVQERPDLFANPQGTVFTILLDPAEIYQVEAYMQQRLIDQGVAKAWATEWSQVGIVFRDQYLLVLRDAVRFPDGTLGTYIRFVDPKDSKPGVIVLP